MPFSSAKQQTTKENRERVNKEHNTKNTQSKMIIITIIKTKISRKNKLKTKNSEQKSNTKNIKEKKNIKVYKKQRIKK